MIFRKKIEGSRLDPRMESFYYGKIGRWSNLDTKADINFLAEDCLFEGHKMCFCMRFQLLGSFSLSSLFAGNWA